MDTLSSSVSTNLQIPGYSSATPHEVHYQFKPIQTTTQQLPPSSCLSNKPRSKSNRHSSPFRSSNNNTTNLITSSSFNRTPQTSSSSIKRSKYSAEGVVHKSASTGYAAALLDISRCNNTLDVVEKDVRRFMRYLRYKDVRTVLLDQLIEDKIKGEMVKEIAVKGKFQKHLVMLVKMLVHKNEVWMVTEVLEEFERIHDELIGTRMVLVSSAEKMHEDQLFGIAKRVQNVTGAMMVKVRHFITGNSPSLAV